MHPTDGRITQEVFNPNQASGQAFPHTGRDYAGNRGDTIRTIADGVVLYVTRENEPVPAWLANRFMLVPGSAAGGNSLFIQHDGWVEYFGHMENITVKVGQRVRRGQRVGGVGDSGNAFGCHLHYEVIKEPCPTSFPWGRYHPQDQIDYEDARGGAASILPTGNIIEEEEDMATPEEIWSYRTTVRGQKEQAIDVLAYANQFASEARDSAARAEAKAEAAINAVAGLLSIQLPHPFEEGKTYALADYIRYGNAFAGQAADVSKAVMANSDPKALAAAVAQAAGAVNAQTLIDQVKVTLEVKENTK